MTAQSQSRLSGRRIVGQSLLLFGGYGLAQLLALARNALLAHLLSKGDFGVAAALTVTLQIFEMLSDPAVDRLIVQAAAKDVDRLVATAHSVAILRGALLGALLFLFAPVVAHLFGIHDATSAFMALAAVPVIRAFLSLDWRRAQRDLSNTPAVLVELVPQAAALAATYPAVLWIGGFEAVVWITIGLALTQLTVTQVLAARRYRIGWDRDWVRRIFAFAWPAMISGLTLLAVYQGDRVLVGRFYGIETLAAYSVAFVLTMVPASLVGRAGTSLLLPVFAELEAKRDLLRTRFLLATEVTVVVTACYLAAFIMLGGTVVELVFGPKYEGLGHLTAVLATMWSTRMLQTPMTAFILAAGEPRSLTIGGALRATALLIGIVVAVAGGGVIVLAATGIAGEALALGYHAWRISRMEPSLHTPMLRRLAYAPVVAVLCWPLVDTGLWVGSSLLTALATAIVVLTLGGGLLVMFRDLRRRLEGLLRNSRGVRDEGLWAAAQVAEVEPS